MAAPRSENVKEIILQQTEKLMEERGIDQISLAMIASACNISKGTLYYHFKTKEDILFALTDRFLKQQEELLLLWIGDQSKNTSLNRMLMYVLQRNYYEIGPRVQLFYSACFGNEVLRQNILDRHHKFQTVISKALMERHGYSKEPADYFAWLSLLLADGMVFQAELRNPNFDVDQFIKNTEKYFRTDPC